MFENRKKEIIKELNEAIKKGRVDSSIVNYLLRINEFEDIYTTSSCAGRVIVLIDGGSKKNSFQVGKWHDIVSSEDIWNKIIQYSNEKLVWLKQEPFILHIICKKLIDAIKIIRIARGIGFKHSGIISMKKERIVCEINGIDRIEIPVIINRKIIINKEHLDNLVDLINFKLSRNRILREEFFKKLFDYLNNKSKS
jgi:tRNA wybutosine-synthesizing protein 3